MRAHLVILALLFGPTAFAAPPVLPSDFCGDPISAICKVPGVTHTGRQIMLSAELHQQRRAALAKVAKANGFDAKSFSEAELQRMPGSRGYSLRFDFAFELVRAHHLDRRSAEWTIVTNNAERLRKMLVAAVVRRGKRSPRQFSSVQVAAMTKALKDVVVLDMEGVMRHRNDARNEFGAIMGNAFDRFCGWDGMGINAFAARLPNTVQVKKRYLVICPGLVLSARGKGDLAWRSLPGVLGTVLHEFAHHVDYGGFAKAFAEFETCIDKNHSLFLKTRPGEERLVSWLTMTPEKRRRKKTAEHMGEITADIWALEAYGPYLAQNARTKAARLDLLRMSFGGYCGTSDEGIHPSGDYRVGLLLRGDPKIARLMGCADRQKIATTCSLDGANVGTLWSPRGR